MKTKNLILSALLGAALLSPIAKAHDDYIDVDVSAGSNSLTALAKQTGATSAIKVDLAKLKVVATIVAGDRDGIPGAMIDADFSFAGGAVQDSGTFSANLDLGFGYALLNDYGRIIGVLVTVHGSGIAAVDSSNANRAQTSAGIRLKYIDAANIVNLDISPADQEEGGTYSRSYQSDTGAAFNIAVEVDNKINSVFTLINKGSLSLSYQHGGFWIGQIFSGVKYQITDAVSAQAGLQLDHDVLGQNKTSLFLGVDVGIADYNNRKQK